MAKQINIENILGSSLVIYQRVEDGHYWFKAKLPKNPAVRESLNTKIRTDAIIEAKKRYMHLEQRTVEGLSLDTKKTVAQVVYRNIQWLKTKPKNYADETIISRIKMLNAYVKIVDSRITDMTKQKWMAHIEQCKKEFVKRNDKEMSPGTESHIRNTINQLYTFCIDIEMVIGERDRVRLPTVRRDMKKARRPAWTEDDLIEIRNKAIEWIALSKDKRVLKTRQLIYYYYRLNLHIGLRPVELKNLRYKDIYEQDGYWYFNVHGKNHQGTAVLNKAGEKYLKLLFDLHKDNEPDSLFFVNAEGNLFKSYWLNLNNLLKFADKKLLDRDGLEKAATFYSSRHSYITYRITSGVSPYDLTKNVRTSLAMIEKVYDKTTSKELSAELTKNTFQDPKKELTTNELLALLKERL